jgi:putative transposase
MPLSERIYYCPTCNTIMDRDVNAAKNILAKATAGMAGSNACGDGCKTAVKEAGSSDLNNS